MKSLVIFLTAGALLAATAANAQPAARDAGMRATDGPPYVLTVKKKRRAPHIYSSEPFYGPPPGSRWRGPDPSYGPGTAQLREYQRQGRCVIDEGYGRYTFCDTY